MKLILYKWGGFNEESLKKALENRGHEVFVFDEKCQHYTRDIAYAQKLLFFIHSVNAEGIVSFNYFPIISMICEAPKIKYYSWVYDCPHFTLYSKVIGLSCNRIGIFDKALVEELNNEGINTVFHLPIAVDCGALADVISNSNEARDYASDISFVGSLYTDNHNYFDLFYKDKYPEAIMKVVKNCCFGNDCREYLDKLKKMEWGIPYVMRQMDETGYNLGEDYYDVKEKVALSSVFEKKITIEERAQLLSAVSEKWHETFSLYTGSDTVISHKGKVDYKSQMPLVFANSKINLNISLRSIHSGIPLRALDIMACGGFLLSNRQKELVEAFPEGIAAEYFSTVDECCDKISYYLSHDDIRKSIALRGQEIVRESFNYERFLGKLLDE